MEMFNKDQKMQFIDNLSESDESKKSYEILFKKVYKKVEKEFDKDICEMSYDELKVSILLLGGRDVKSVAWNISRLKQYIDWCIVNGKTHMLENHLSLINANNIDNSYIFKQEMIKSPEQLNEMLDVVYPDMKELWLTNIYRIYFWLLYNGLTNTEAVNLKRDQIDLRNGIINVNDRQIRIYPQFKELLDITLPESKLMWVVRNTETFTDLYETDYVLRVFRNTVSNREIQFGAKITSFNKKYRKEADEYIKLSPIRIYESGLFYRWYQMEINKEKIPFDDYLKIDVEGKKFSINPNYIINDKRKSIELEYNTWKKAFGY